MYVKILKRQLLKILPQCHILNRILMKICKTHNKKFGEKKMLNDLFNFRWQICCFTLWRATNQKRQSRRWIQNLQMSELFFLFSYTLNQNLIFFFNNFRWKICCFALWRASNQKCQSRRWFQNLQMSNKTSADWRNKTVGYSWTTGHHR